MGPRIGRRAVARGATRAGCALLLAAAGLSAACGDGGRAGGAAVPAAVECLRIEAAPFRLSADPSCAVAGDDFARRLLPDLGFTPGACFRTGATALRAVAADGAALDLSFEAFSGIDTNAVAGTGLAPLPVPLVDPAGEPHAYIAFTAASVIAVASPAGQAIGRLVMRDAGWAELRPPASLPVFVSERLTVTGGDGALAGAVGEVIATGDEFAGIPARGSLCGPGLFAALERAVR